MMGYKWIPEKAWIEANQKLGKLSSDISSATEFVREIERGNLDFSIGTDAADSELKTSLVNMRDQMKKYALTEKQRNWVNEGLAKFVQILRSTNIDDRQDLSDNIIRNLVTYLKANQGALFALNDDDPNDIFLEMEACYAYDRKKFFEKRIAIGEGLAGQVVLEKSTVYMTDVPNGFVKITSGLGEALPRNILLVPLKLDDKVYGVVEVASFQLFEQHAIEFVERLGESIASTISAVKNNDRTRKLLEETQLQAEQLKAQEEEVRQNLEELSATQEAMQRAMNEVEGKEAYMSQVLNTSQDVIYTVDREFRMVTWNSVFKREADRVNVKVEKGMNAFEWAPEERRKLVQLYSRAIGGETFETNYDLDLGGQKYYFLTTYAPLKSPSGEVTEVGVYAKNITAVVLAQQEATRLMKEAQLQADQLKAQEEKLRQNMRELSSTQDVMKGAMVDLEQKDAYTTELLNATDDLIYSVDKEFRLVTWNTAFAKLQATMDVKLEKRMDAFGWLSDYRQSLIPLWSRALNGEKFQFRWESKRGDIEDHYLSILAPVKSHTGEIIEVVIFAKNIAELVVAQRDTARLLKDAQQQAEQLKAQEEELRQNMEELSATQDAIQGTMKEIEGKEAYMSQILNTSQDVIYTVDREFRMMTWNSVFTREAERINIRVEKGMNAFEWAPDERKKLIQLYTRVFNGETFEMNYDIDLGGKTYYFLTVYAPLRSPSGQIIEAAIFARNVTSMVEAQAETARLLKGAQQQTEELKAQEEELRQNMEELHSIQEDLSRKNNEIEKNRILERDRTEALAQSHKKNMLNITTRFRQLEAEYKNKIALLENNKAGTNGTPKSKG